MLKSDGHTDEHDDDLEAEVIEGAETETGIEREAFPDPDAIAERETGRSTSTPGGLPGGPEATEQPDDDSPDSM